MNDLYVITSDREFNGQTIHHTKFCYTLEGKEAYLLHLKRIAAVVTSVKHYKEVP